ncbi:MAG: accessory factor UbiK family protein [Hyphomicrobiales bacterium]
MTQTTGRFFDEIGRLVTDAAGAAQGLRKEIETVVRGQAERVLRDLDIVQREEFEAIREMARIAREENESLSRRVRELEEEIRALKGKGAPSQPRRPVRRRKVKRSS